MDELDALRGLKPAAPEGHTPVMPREVCEALSLRAGETVIDATVGLGGHSRLFAEAIGASGRLIAFDLDADNLRIARQRLADSPCRVDLVQSNFSDLRDALGGLGVERVDALFADLGVSSTQLDARERGFSFLYEGPLDMRMDPHMPSTASDLVNRLGEKELGDLLFHNAQEIAGRRIAKRICQERREGRITTTQRLARIVADAVGVGDPLSRRSKTHPATRTFLALRIAVNDEMKNLDALLASIPWVLSPGGRVGMLSFHSEEDKRVKADFRARQVEKVYQILTKKPMVASEQERESNPRSRSAKFRAAVRLATETSG
ncbi:MAG: 16S rRNA (cytosine(1402)-N(4))-methyltransferase RsmH [Planctomycetota bacterium]